MLEPTTSSVLLITTAITLIGLYWGALILGGGLLLVSVLGGLGHHHADTDAGTVPHHDAGSDSDSAHAAHDAAAMSTWFSLRFAVFFLAMYGATGVILTYLSGASTWMVFSLALVIGLAVGQGAHQTFRFVRRTSGDSTPRTLDYVNRLGRVTIAVIPPEQGEVALEVRGTERFVPAVAAERTGFDVGDEVVVVDYRDGVAHVTRPIGKT
jgi:membrane protein implicated in regulation of membrane protease activity